MAISVRIENTMIKTNRPLLNAGSFDPIKKESLSTIEVSGLAVNEAVQFW